MNNRRTDFLIKLIDGLDVAGAILFANYKHCNQNVYCFYSSVLNNAFLLLWQNVIDLLDVQIVVFDTF